MEESYEIEFEEYLANGITNYKCLICGESFHDVQLLVDHSSKIDETVMSEFYNLQLCRWASANSRRSSNPNIWLLPNKIDVNSVDPCYTRDPQ